MVKLRLWAAQELLNRYKCSKKVEIPVEELIEALAVIISVNTKWYQKKAARIILDYQFGKNEVNEMIADSAVITDRNDPLVSKWRKKVIERDGKCVGCGVKENLQAHHISFWSDDPVNRINVDNGVALCVDCHAAQHPEISNLILSTKKGVV